MSVTDLCPAGHFSKQQTALKLLYKKLHFAPANQTHLCVKWSCCFHQLCQQVVLVTQAGKELSASTAVKADPTVLSSWHSCVTTESTACILLSVRQQALLPAVTARPAVLHDEVRGQGMMPFYEHT